MGFFDFLRTKQLNNVVEDSEISTASALYESMYGVAGVFWNEVDALQAYRLYTRSSVLGMAVHRIARAMSQLQLGLTSDDLDFAGDDPVLDLIEQPTGGYTKMRLMYEIATSYLLTNEAWLILRGRINAPPLERTWVYPYDLSMSFSASDGLPDSIRTNAKRDNRTYSKQFLDGRVRYIDARDLNELVPIIGKESSSGDFRGMSPVGQLLYDIQQGVDGKRHNSAVLSNGIKTSAVVMPPDGQSFDKKAMADIGAAIRSKAGSGMAGGTLVFPKPFNTKDVGTTNQEMDYIRLLEESQQAVFNFYGIPLPMVMMDATTFNNYTTAQMSFYDQAVFPVFDAIADVLSKALEPRFPILEDAQITYNENTIKPLTSRNIERMEAMRKTQSLTTDEIRASAGYLPIEGGADVLVASSLVPLGDPLEGIELPALPEDDEEIEEEIEEEEEE